MEAQTDPSLTEPPTATRADPGATSVPALLPYASLPPPIHDARDRELAAWSLLCGVIICVPFVTGILSVVFATAVLCHAYRLRKLDLALAVLGLAAGSVNLSLWVMRVWRL